MKRRPVCVQKWTAARIPDQSGRVAIVTGSNSGLGYATAKALADSGAHVVLAVRDVEKGRAAVRSMSRDNPLADCSVQRVDLADLNSVWTAADELKSQYPEIDLLINNAGVCWTPYMTTADGFELQFGTNHLGHFALTGLLLAHMLPVHGSRVVTVSSKGHTYLAPMHFEDPQWKRHRYNRFKAYGQSKLANLLFTYELDRRLTASRSPTISVAAHPGVSGGTDLGRFIPFVSTASAVLGPYLFPTGAEFGARPTLRAATDTGVRGGEYYGPDGFAGLRGNAAIAESSRRSHDAEAQRRLWLVSSDLTGVDYPV
ncbi:SDR family NAD(P)-dependent oxidoreductase [Mycobacterium colombiense]|uniref:SDR family NAD(P)-dependent oxidoreductase n=1 Tax=Mycobacterium colombiense TaxID=339268 RepID=UPI000949E32F|nr:SDR family NAD(P)-dependent oxidoreductase [Mycobacterium colombiense]